jgi:hypothetical protein
MPNKLKKILKNMVIVSIFLFGLVYLISSYLIVDFYPNSSGIAQNNSNDMDIIELFIYSPKSGRTDLCVPEAYFTYSKEIRRGVKKKISLELHYPSLKPWNIYATEFKQQNIDYKNWSRKKQRAWVVDKSYLTLNPSFGAIAVNHFWNNEFFGTNSNSNTEAFEQIKKGIWRLKDKGKYLSSLDDYFVSPDPKNFTTVVECKSTRRCTLETFVTDSMTFRLNFSRKHMDNLQGLSSDIKSLARTFICHKD